MLSILISALTLVKAQSTVAYTLQALLLQNSLPTQYPALTQTEMIAPNLVNSAFLAPYISYVKSVVPASILSIAVSTYNPGTPSTPTYNSDKVANCYWPDVLCTRNTDTAYIKADISTCPNQNDWGLTFDDGPVIDPRGIFGTPQLLNALEAANIKATFFVVGLNAFKNKEVLKTTEAKGHQLALHTWTHHPLTSLSNEQIVAEIVYNAAIVYEATGKVPLHFRPPYGDMDDRVRAIVTALGLRTIYWTTTPSRDSGDTNRSGFPTVAAVVSYVVSWWETFTNSAGFISLSHDISSFTVEAGIKSIQAIQAAQSTGTFSLKPQPVGTCVGLQQSTSWYFAGATQPTASTSSSTTRPTTPPPAINGASGNTVAMTILALVFASFLIQVLF